MACHEKGLSPLEAASRALRWTVRNVQNLGDLPMAGYSKPVWRTILTGDQPLEPNESQPVIGQPQATSTDKSLLTRYRRGDDDAATELYLRYADRLRALATNQTSALLQQRVDAEDMVQSVFRTFFRRASIGQYDIPEGDELWKLLLSSA